ncbi:hypothetical protein DWU89_00630 [Parabacteroides acidifaciens]|jgi:hypothetical protein|uniref:Uncharacterized protein n=1 Tax=Parabacteroides acidifaciens TaxID=2290935 RepID=A0A3D8HJK6_9BACT|nr:MULTISPECIES: hypothetical protein [unclassified Parabacteroides]RDU51169.1 hypothetical protein DWU89_00630 [Parabacteroides acidifaciens]RHO70722.1 hypothetical protein DW083_12905 [Parabacteroides sp. AF48-14]RHR61328.1 hypothetical protein DWW90_04185 [Parabacteroides sp. AF17-28]
MKHVCTKCPLRAKYDKAPKSLIGRFWRWHIDYCPGWRKYFTSLSKEEQAELRKQYKFTRYA